MREFFGGLAIMALFVGLIGVALLPAIIVALVTGEAKWFLIILCFEAGLVIFVATCMALGEGP